VQFHVNDNVQILRERFCGSVSELQRQVNRKSKIIKPIDEIDEYALLLSTSKVHTIRKCTDFVWFP